MDFLPALCRADPVHREQLSCGHWVSGETEQCKSQKKTKTEVKLGFNILKKTPKVVPRAAPGVAVNFARTWNWPWAQQVTDFGLTST